MCQQSPFKLIGKFARTLFFSTLFCLSFFSAVRAQEQIEDFTEWNVPLTNVGDSTRPAARGSKLVVTGTVMNVDTGRPIAGALVSADFLKHFDYTDEDGRYSLELPPGDYKIKVRQVGFLPAYIRAQVHSNGLLDVDLHEGVVQLSEVLITSRPIDSNVKEALAGLTKLNVREIKTLPTLSGDVDILKSLQLMPGVTSVGEGSSGINVRGGRVDQNLVLFNDVPLFNTSHALGFVSAFNQDIVDNFSLYKGNVPANLGGRASSVIEINTRRGNFEKWNYEGGIGPVSTRFTVDGPLTKSSTSLLMAGRLSHANWLLRKVKDPDVRASRLMFYDGYAGIAHRFNENSSADVTFYGSHDNFQFSDQFGYRWQNYLLSGRWRSMADRKLSPVLSLAYGKFRSTLYTPSGTNAYEITNTIDYFQLKESVNYAPDDQHNLTGGVAAIAYIPGDEYRKGYNGNPLVTRKQAGKNSGIEFAAFINDDYELNEKIAVTAGLRYSLFYHIGPDTVYNYMPGAPRTSAAISDTTIHDGAGVIDAFWGLEPRISLRFSITKDKSIKAGYNRMRQYIHLISNTTAPTPVDIWQSSTRYLQPQVADNFSIGYFQNMKDNLWETSAEVFYKRMNNLVEYKDFPELFLNDHMETELLSGNGRAWGAEIFIRRLKGRWTGWLSYTYSLTEVQVQSLHDGETINGGEWFPSNYNKPHTVNLVLNKAMRGKSAMSFILTYNTGRPYTAIESSYISGSTVIPIYSDRNAYTIPGYFRADVSITIGSVSKKFEDSLVLSIYNIFGRENAYSVFYQRPAENFFIPKPFKLSVLGAALPSITYNFRIGR